VLVVGGGGGAGRSGVKNSITVFDFSSRAPTVEPIAELEASKDDSVTCLANLATRNGILLFGGINSSEEDRLKGKNEHFRAFEVQFTDASENVEGGIEFLSKTKLLATPHTVAAKEGYQRIVRLSPPMPAASTSNAPNRRIGAIASSLAAEENEIVIFIATSSKPMDEDVICRTVLHAGDEANDLDITQKEGRFQVAYATDHDLFIQNVNYDFDARKMLGKNEHEKAYTTPMVVGDKNVRSKLRCVRWLSQKHLLILANKPSRTGVELLILRLDEEGAGRIVLHKNLPRHIKTATDLDVAMLDSDADGAYQIVIAIAAIDISLSVYTMDYHGPASDSLSSLHAFNRYDSVSRQIPHLIAKC
jgi:prolactin regulatory element-binding protein